MLTKEQIIGLLGKSIIIHPFDPEALRGATYNLKVGDFLWLHPTDKGARDARNILPEVPVSGHYSVYNPITDTHIEREGKYYLIPPNGLATVLTREVLYVDRTIAGHFHSKVDMVTKGFSHISTTLDPDWIGPLLITIKNQNHIPLELWQGETFVKLSLNKLARRTSYRHNNDPGRGKLIAQQGFIFPSGDQDFLDKSVNSNLEALKNAFENSETWQEFLHAGRIKASKSFHWLTLIASGLGFVASLTAFIWLPKAFNITLGDEALVGIVGASIVSFQFLLGALKDPPWKS